MFARCACVASPRMDRIGAFEVWEGCLVLEPF